MKLAKLVGVTALGMLAALPAKALDIGDSLVDGDVKMENIDGSQVTINGLHGDKGTLVIFTCNHCPVAKAWQTTMVEIANDYQKKGIAVVFINANDPAAYKEDDMDGMKKMAKNQGYEFPYVVDATSDVARHFGATKTPDVFLFDADGKLAYKGAVGEGGGRPKKGGDIYLKDALDALLASQPIAKPETKGMGCSIQLR